MEIMREILKLIFEGGYGDLTNHSEIVFTVIIYLVIIVIRKVITSHGGDHEGVHEGVHEGDGG